MTMIEEKIADIIYGNDLATAASTILEIMQECQRHPVEDAIDLVCELRFG